MAPAQDADLGDDTVGEASRWRLPVIHGDRIAVGTRTGHVHVIDTDGETVDEYEVSPTAAITSVAFGPDGTILSLTADGRLDRTVPESSAS